MQSRLRALTVGGFNPFDIVLALFYGIGTVASVVDIVFELMVPSWFHAAMFTFVAAVCADNCLDHMRQSRPEPVASPKGDQ